MVELLLDYGSTFMWQDQKYICFRNGLQFRKDIRMSVRRYMPVMLIALLFLASGCGTERPSVILIIVDALRADHLGCYGYCRETSPTIDSLATSGVRWTTVQAQAPWTLPGCASILSGLTPKSHGAREDVGNLQKLSPEMPTAATIFSENDYYTVGIANGFWVGPELGFNLGYESFYYADDGNGRAEISVDELITELQQLNSNKPFFAMLHLYDVHSPYDPPLYYTRYWALNNATNRVFWNVEMDLGILHDREHCQDYINLYDGEIRWVDDQLSRLFSWLRLSERAENTIVVLTSDHGEEFLEHGWIEHSTTLYQELLHVPLIISGPGVPENVTCESLTGHIDILPTILKLSQLEIPQHLEGYPLLPLEENPLRAICSSGTTPDHWHPDGLRNRNWASVRRGNMKLIYFSAEDSSVVFDLATDPGELIPLEPDRELLDIAERYWASPPLYSNSSPPTLSDETLRTLKGLGYI